MKHPVVQTVLLDVRVITLPPELAHKFVVPLQKTHSLETEKLSSRACVQI